MKVDKYKIVTNLKLKSVSKKVFDWECGKCGENFLKLPPKRCQCGSVSFKKIK